MIRTFQATIQIAVPSEPSKDVKIETELVRDWLEKFSGMCIHVQSIKPMELADFPEDELPTRREGILKK